MVNPEDLAMMTIFDWIRLNPSIRDIAFHITNEGKRSPQLGAKLKRMGLKAGVSDIFIPKASKGYHGLFIEVKAKNFMGKYGKLTKFQQDFLNLMKEGGYAAELANGADAAIKIIKDYLSIS